MMLKVNDEYLDFNELVEVDKRSKLLEEIDSTSGDFSYSFEIQATNKNLSILGFPLPNVGNKAIYQELKADLMDDSGTTLYKGVLLVTAVLKYTIQCSFLSGNYNWFSLLNGPMTDIDYSEFDTDLTDVNIANSWDNTEGVVFPFMDAGALLGRSYRSLVVEDFIGCLFVKDIFRKIFTSLDIKLKGDFLKDPLYNTMIVATNITDPDGVSARSMYARKTSDESFPDPTSTNVQFQDDSTLPFFDGSQDNYNASTSTYTSDVKQKVRVDVTITYFDDSLVSGGKEFGVLVVSDFTKMYDFETTLLASNPTYPYTTFSASTIVTLEAGETLQPFVNYNPAGSTATLVIKSGSTFKVTPIFIYTARGNAMVPKDWTNQQFVSNILKLFCCIPDYDPYRKELTINLFDDIKQKEPINLSNHLQVDRADYYELLQSYGQTNYFSYDESDSDQVKEYNIKNFLKYGSGEIQVDNFYIQKTAEIIQSDFKAPVSYEHPAFTASVERMEFLELESEGSEVYTSVTDSFGDARFNVADDTLFSPEDVVEITESSIPAYNGQYVVKSTGSGTGFIILIGVPFSFDGTGIITKLNHVVGSDNGVYLLINTQYRDDSVPQYSRGSKFFIGLNTYANVGYAYFNLLNLGLPINNVYKQSLSFGRVNSELFYQRTIIDTYWTTVSRMLNDPVKLFCTGHIPKKVFLSLTPLRPVEITMEQATGLYYLNLLRGYKGSEYPCEAELIKLS